MNSVNLRGHQGCKRDSIRKRLGTVSQREKNSCRRYGTTRRQRPWQAGGEMGVPEAEAGQALGWAVEYLDENQLAKALRRGVAKEGRNPDNVSEYVRN